MRRTGALALALSLAACGSGLRTVPTGPHASSATTPVVVDSPPPPAKIETIPEDPGAPCAWLDGRWNWVNGAWEWSSGQWVRAPEECYFASPEALWVPTSGRGLLFYLPGRWYRQGGARCSEPPACGARRSTR